MASNTTKQAGERDAGKEGGLDYLEMMKQDVDSALSLLRSVESQINNCNFLAAIGTLSSIGINLAMAESKRNLYFAMKGAANA